jgi:hypothetical protein
MKKEPNLAAGSGETMSLARYVRRVPPITRGAPRRASSWYAHRERARRAFFEQYNAEYERLKADPEAWNEMLREREAFDPVSVHPLDFLEIPARTIHQPFTGRKPPRGTISFRPLGLTRLTWQRSCPDGSDREFEEAMRRAFERLSADPVAWREYLEESASINPAFADLLDLS